MYEMWDARREGGGFSAGAMKSYKVGGDGRGGNQSTSASGFAVSAGMVVREDFMSNGKLNPNKPIPHALAIAIPHELLQKGAFTGPATRGDNASDNTGNVKTGTRFALPRDANIDSMNVHPLTKALARAARDYGVFVVDRAGSNNYKGKQVGTVKIEPGVTEAMWGKSSDALMPQVREELYQIFQKYGMYRVE
jgi:hypothetical protein